MPAKKSGTKKRRAEPGSTGEGNYYHIVIRDKNDFVTFRNHDVGDKGGLQRLAGQRENGSWDDVTWLIEKDMAHVSGKTLVADVPEAQEILEQIGPVKHWKGDIFKGHPKK